VLVEPVNKAAAQEMDILRRSVDDLRRVVADQASVIEKARLPRSSNVIPLAQTVPNNGTINASETTWPADLAPSNRKSVGNKF